MSAKQHSVMWNFFKILDSTKKTAKCDLCGLIMSYKSTTANLKNHIRKKHPTVDLNQLNTCRQPTSQSHHIQTSTITSNIPVAISSSSETNSRPDVSCVPIQTSSSSATNSRPDVSCVPIQTSMGNYLKKRANTGEKRKLDRSLLCLFTNDYQPFSVVEDTGFKKFVSVLNPAYSLPDRKTISNTLIPAAFEECKTNVKSQLKDVDTFCLTTDCWSSSAQESYLALTAHFITNNFCFESVLLDCCLLEGSHTSVALASKITEILSNFDILLENVKIIVLDNAQNIKSAITNHLNLKHFGCYAHTLNLIVTDAIQKTPSVQTIIDKVKPMVKHFKRSNQDLEKLIKYQRDSGVQTPKRLILDVSTRWNSTFYMLERVNELQEAIRSTLALIDKEITQLTVEEWKICADLCKVLKPYEDVTRKLSGEKYVSGSHIIFLTTGLTDVNQKLLKKPLHKTALEFTQNLQVGILTRFPNLEMSKTVATCSFLDPRFKLFPFTNVAAKTMIKEHVYKLATAISSNERAKLTDHTQPQLTRQQDDDEDADLCVTAFFDDLVRKAQPSGTALSSAIVEVNRYLDERPIDRREDPLKWWAANQYSYPLLSKLVKCHFNMVATSVPCERIFSKTGQLINDRRTSLKPSKVRQLIFLNANSKYWSK